jgi:hypothetical protein
VRSVLRKDEHVVFGVIGMWVRTGQIDDAREIDDMLCSAGRLELSSILVGWKGPSSAQEDNSVGACCWRMLATRASACLQILQIGWPRFCGANISQSSVYL